MAFGDHDCGVCYTNFLSHHERCYDPSHADEGMPVNHFPALCCPGCGCGSYERAHLTLTWTRERRRGGPADTLNGRWEIHGQRNHWWVTDRQDRRWRWSSQAPSMRRARFEAIELAVEAARQTSLKEAS